MVLRTERDGPVAVVTLDRPAARNALSSELIVALRSTMAGLDADDDVRAVVLTGTDPAFCAGLDLGELASGGGNLRSAGRGPFRPLHKLVVGAINGAAYTGGLELALCCDLRIASERAVFADTHARVGVMPGWGLTVKLPQAVGQARALEMSFGGTKVDAELALRWGLVNHVVPHDELLPEARAVAARAAELAPAAAAKLLQMYRSTSGVPEAEALAAETRECVEWIAGMAQGATPSVSDLR